MLPSNCTWIELRVIASARFTVYSDGDWEKNSCTIHVLRVSLAYPLEGVVDSDVNHSLSQDENISEHSLPSQLSSGDSSHEAETLALSPPSSDLCRRCENDTLRTQVSTMQTQIADLMYNV